MPQSKSNMADGHHLENHYDVITPPSVVHSGKLNFVQVTTEKSKYKPGNRIAIRRPIVVQTVKRLNARITLHKISKSKVALNPHTRLRALGLGIGADSGFLAVSQQVTLVVNPVVGCLYFLPGLRLLSQPKKSLQWPVPNYTQSINQSIHL